MVHYHWEVYCLNEEDECVNVNAYDNFEDAMACYHFGGDMLAEGCRWAGVDLIRSEQEGGPVDVAPVLLNLGMAPRRFECEDGEVIYVEQHHRDEVHQYFAELRGEQ